MSDYITVIRTTSLGGCGCSSAAVSSCHVFTADTREALEELLKKTLLGWLWRDTSKQMTKGQFEEYKKDEEKIISFVEEDNDTVNVVSYQEEWENLNNCCEFTQEIFVETVSYEESLSPAEKAAITRKAIREGKNPVMVHAGHKAAFTRKSK